MDQDIYTPLSLTFFFSTVEFVFVASHHYGPLPSLLAPLCL